MILSFPSEVYFNHSSVPIVHPFNSSLLRLRWCYFGCGNTSRLSRELRSCRFQSHRSRAHQQHRRSLCIATRFAEDPQACMVFCRHPADYRAEVYLTDGRENDGRAAGMFEDGCGIRPHLARWVELAEIGRMPNYSPYLIMRTGRQLREDSFARRFELRPPP